MRKIISFFLIAVFLIAPVSAASSSSSDVEYVQKAGFWTWAAGQNEFLHGLIGSTGASCPNSEDGYHHASSYQRPEASWGGLTGYYKCICDLCGAEFKAYESDLQQSYDVQVSELPAPNYGSNGELRWRLNVRTFEIVNSYNSLLDQKCGSSFSVIARGSGASTASLYGYFDEFVSPILGNYQLSLYFCGNKDYWLCKEQSNYYILNFPLSWYTNGSLRAEAGGVWFNFTDTRSYVLGDVIVAQNSRFSLRAPSDSVVTSVSGFWELICTPVALPGNTYNINSRPTSITGNYGIIGDNGQIIKVEGDKIVNETNNTYYNPATGATDTITDWSYNYEDRSYTLTLGGGTTTTVTYGDENVVIKEGDVTYNIYYLVDGSGTENPGPEVCDHDWTEDSTIRPTCSTPGKVTMTCSKCGQTKTETLPALGHNWTVERTVQTSYDENGNLIQQGYTIYKCSVCGEQYKDSDGTGPPGTPGGSGPGGSGGDEEKSIWEKIGEFFGTLGGGFIDIIGAIAGKLLDALTKLAEMLLGKIKTVVETILTIFDELPALFGGFLDFLGAVFPFLPPEITTILTFGVIAITFIGILKAVRR